MREKIWKLIKYKCGYTEVTDQILSLLKEEIKKVENSYKDMVFPSDYQNGEYQGFEQARQKILKILT